MKNKAVEQFKSILCKDAGMVKLPLVGFVSGQWSRIAFYMVLLIFIAYRAYFVAFISVDTSGYSFAEMLFETLSNDVYVIAFIVSLEILIASLRIRLFSIIIKSLIVLLVFGVITDVLVFKYMANRINIDDIIQYGGEVAVIGEMVNVVSSTYFGLLGLLLIGLLVLATPGFILSSDFTVNVASQHKTTGNRLLLIVLAGLGTFLSFVYGGASAGNNNIHQLRSGNIFYALSSYSYKNKYSLDFKEQYVAVKQTIEDSRRCVRGMAEQRNVILVIVESLSAYHSHYFSGLNNFTPNIDTIARKNIAFKNFHANGFTTVGGYMALLNGLIPVPKTSNEHTAARGGWVALSGFENNPFSLSLPEVFNENGYQTLFMSNADLAFAGSLDWLQNIGFQTVEDASSPEFDGYPRFLFNAPSDAALFTLAKKRMAVLNNKYLLVLSMISTHRPYIDVVSGQPGNEKSSFMQLDKVLGEFYRYLQDSGYFDNGILLITGDHRAMTPTAAGELELFGDSAGNRVPLILVDRNLPAPVEVLDHYQHVDVFSSLKTFAGSESCELDLFGSFYNGQSKASRFQPPQCLFFARGDDRNMVSVRCGEQKAAVLLDGDDTRIVKGELNQASTVVQLINALRIKQ